MAGGNQSDESGLLLAVVSIVGGGILFAIWWFFGQELMNMVRWVRYGEAQLISLVLGADHTYFDPEIGGEFTNDSLLLTIEALYTDELETSHIGLFTRSVMSVLKWPIAAILGILGLWCVFRGPGTLYRRKLNLDGLIGEQSISFPVIKPFVKFDPRKLPFRVPGSPVPAELPPFAEALSPEEWVAYNLIPMPDGKMDVNAAKNAFVQQLGRRWKGLNSLKPHERALFATFALKSVRKRKEADDLLSEIALCWDDKKGLQLSSSVKSKVNKILRDAKITKPIYMEANRHAYVKTAMLRALAHARKEGGVLAAAQFVWLRGHDRELWYPLNNLGRRSFHSEAMGVMAHYVAEKSMNRAIPMPQVSSAVDSLQHYLKKHEPIAIPKLDYKDSKKRSGIMKPSSAS